MKYLILSILICVIIGCTEFNNINKPSVTALCKENSGYIIWFQGFLNKKFNYDKVIFEYYINGFKLNRDHCSVFLYGYSSQFKIDIDN